ncbi:MAG: FeoA family protein [Methanothrix sp.]|nr:FeoA family protein [Methanothrix sp.]
MSNMKRLDELMPGQRGRIASISPCGNLRRRMMEMGLVIGSEIMVIRLRLQETRWRYS